jgi:hypothetical protein
MPLIRATRLFFALAITVAIPLAAVAQSKIVGDWRGTLKSVIDKREVRLILHITTTPEGILTATIDSLDQDSPGIPVSGISYENLTLKMDITQARAAFEGKLNKDGTEIDGIWTEGKRQTLKFKRVTDPAKVTQPFPIGGEWHGTLSVPGKQFDIVLNVNTTDYSRPVATIEGINQSTHGVNSIMLKNNILKFAVDAVHASYVGTVSDDGNEINGVWKQDQSIPLIFHRIAPPTHL